MRLIDHHGGADDAFEGDRTLQWRSLPVNALVTKATLKVTPTKSADTTLFQEVISFTDGQGDLGATKNLGSGFVEVDFHRRRTLAVATGPHLSNTNLQVDLGGVYVEINTKGAIRTPGDNPFPVPADGTLPSLTVNKFKLTPPATGSTGAPNVTTVTIRTVPTNLVVRLGTLPPVWTRLGEMTAAETSPDFAAILQAFLASATAENGYYVVPLVLHSDTVCRLDVDLEVEYVMRTSLQPPGLKEVVLPYDYGTVPKADPGVLHVALPANTRVLSDGTTTRVKGTFDETRVVYGPTGSVVQADSVSLSSAESQAQILSLDSAQAATAVDLFLIAVSRTVRLGLDLRGDLDGKPDAVSLLAASVQFVLDGAAAGAPTWVSVPLPSRLQFQPASQRRYWVVLQSFDGEAAWNVQSAAPGAVALQHTRDGGLSWRDTPSSKVPGALAAILRLRDKPDRFQVPVELEVGAGSQAVRVKLDRYQPLGRVDFAIDSSDLAGAFNRYSSAALPAACPEGEQLANGDFGQWNVVGNEPGDAGFIRLAASPVAVAAAPDGRWVYVPGILDETLPLLSIVDVICDEFKISVQLKNLQEKHDTPQAVAVHPDGSRAYVLGHTNLDVIDATTRAELGVLPWSAIDALKIDSTGGGFGTGLALSPDGSRLYATTVGSTIVGLDTTRLEQAVVGQATLAPADVVIVDVGSPARAIAVTHDGSRLYATVPGRNSVAAVDTATRQHVDIAVGATPAAIALTPDGSLAIVGNTADNTLSVVETASRQGSTIKLGGQPAGVAVSPDGRRAFVATGQMASGTANAVTVVDLDRRAVSGTPKPLTVAPSAIAITPQGDRVYVIPAAATAEIAGIAAHDAPQVAFIPIGVRVPAEWFLTSGQVLPVCLPELPPPGLAVVFGHRTRQDFEANVAATALSQVIPVAASCNYTISFRGLAMETGAVAEVFWLGQDCEATRTDQVPIQAVRQSERQQRLVLHRAQFSAPPGAAQAEVRFSAPPGVIAGIANASLTATSESLANGDLQILDEHGGFAQWTPPAQASSQIVVTASAGARVIKNPAGASAELAQVVNVVAGKAFVLRFEGRAVPLISAENHPSIDLHWLAADGSEIGAPLNLPVAPENFDEHAASGVTPDGTAQAGVHVVLPAGTALMVNEISFQAQDSPSIPLSFVAQAPGELRVTEARVVYDEVSGGRILASKGLCAPTPPGRRPGEPVGDSCFCPCCQNEQTLTQAAAAVTAAGRPAVQGRCANCGAEMVRGGGVVAAGAPSVAVRRLPIATRVPGATPERPEAVVIPSLAAILGIGKGRMRQLTKAGITSVAELAASSPAKVAQALTGVSPKNAAVFIERAREILRTTASRRPGVANPFAPDDDPAEGPSASTPQPPIAKGESLASISGLGPRRRALLAAAGIDSVERLAAATAEQVGRVLKDAGVALKYAAVFIERAKQVLAS